MKETTISTQPPNASALQRPDFRAILAACASVIALAGGLSLFNADSAQANSPILVFENKPSTTQAGGHPDILTVFHTANRYTQNFPSSCYCEDAENVTVHLPTGVIGDPHAAPLCGTVEFATSTCPPETQVGISGILLFEAIGQGGQTLLEPIFNLVPHHGQAGLLGFNAPIVGTPIFTVLSSRTGSDYGLDATVAGISHFIPIFGVAQVLWGVPADSSHDALRFPYLPPFPNHGCGFADPVPYIFGDGATFPPFCYPGAPTPSNSQAKPFLSNPTTCSGPLTSSLDVDSYDHGTSHADSPWPQATGCDQLAFNPSLSAQPTTTQTDSPSGLEVDLSVPQFVSPTTPSPSEIRATTVTLPKGLSINPNAADGKTACADAAANFGTEDAANCPEFAKVGTLEIDSSALPGPLPGYIYLGQPLPGNRYRIFLVADGFATHIKLPGTVTPDPQTGQIVVSFQNLPQSPLTDFKLHFFGSERGLFATPTQCGTYSVKSTFTPWDEQLANQSSTQFFAFDSGPNGTPCPGAIRPFNPNLQAGDADNTAGAHTPFTLDLTRSDGDQNLTALDVSTPPGFSGTLKGIPYCPQSALDQISDSTYPGLAEQASSACPTASQIGTATAATGGGTHPLYSPGKVYLAGPYKGAPLSLEVVIPAVSGPYDIGNVAVRAAINVDPITAQISTVSDPLPQILDGIPLRVRSLQINLDRPNFALNPTNCNSMAVTAQVFGDQGARADLSAPFQIANCASLGFSPKLAMRFQGGTKRRAHPALHATLTTNPGNANISRVAVTLPPSELLDQSHIGSSCTRTQFATNSCPANTVLGTAIATSPLLDQPLSGTVYLVSSGNRLPDIVAALRGQFSIDLHGKIDTVHRGLRTTFQTVPDVPVTSFSLNLEGGSKGLLVNSKSICGRSLKALVKVLGQNGLTADQDPVLQTPCGKARHKRNPQRSRAVR
jgi:hypothetical protein